MPIVTLNAGSSSLKFALFSRDARQALLRGKVDADAGKLRLRWQTPDREPLSEPLPAAGAQPDEGWASALPAVLRLIERQTGRHAVAAVGHRIVHGGTQFVQPVRVDAGVLAQLESLIPLAPLHQPQNLALVRAAQDAFGTVPQIACFDTAFHRAHPQVADIYALPARWYDAGIRRYGFHGLSYQSAVEMLRACAPRAGGRVAIAHLGSGASLCAVRDGRSLDCTMGFSPLDGLPMATRCGQIDPGVLLHLMQEHGLGVEQLAELLYRNSGLNGLSGLSGDMRVLEAQAAAGHTGANLAIDYFIARLQREIAAAAGTLGGLDALVFTGGIGEHSVLIRRRTCSRLAWLGMELDDAANDAGEQRISSAASRLAAFVLPTDEEAQIARACARMLPPPQR